MNSCSCKKCRFYTNGECRVNPPSDKGFPKVSENGWCGKFELDRFSNNEELSVPDGRILLNE